MSCSEVENHFFSTERIAQGSEECNAIHEQHFDDCCYDIPCDLCMSETEQYNILTSSEVFFNGAARTCGDVSVLVKAEMSQSDVCTSARDDAFDTCCYKQCDLCDEPKWVVDWNHPLTFEGAESSCLDAYMMLYSEKVEEESDRCGWVRDTLGSECCYRLPSNQCSLCQTSDGKYLSTNWNYGVFYKDAAVTCGDVNALLSAEELDSDTCLVARDQLWDSCCVPHEDQVRYIASQIDPPTQSPVKINTQILNAGSSEYAFDGYDTYLKKGKSSAPPGLTNHIYLVCLASLLMYNIL